MEIPNEYQDIEIENDDSLLSFYHEKPYLLETQKFLN